MKTTYKMWTKDEVKKMAKLWETMTTQELAKELKRPTQAISAMGGTMRKAGFKLPRKHHGGYMQSLLREVLAEIKK